MDRIAAFFSEKSKLQDPVDKATSDFLISEDWSANVEICDIVKATGDEGAKEVIKAIRSRLKNKNPKVQLLSLILLEALVKNCEFPLHAAVAQRDFMNDIAKMAVKSGSGADKPGELEVREKVLDLIQSWATAFQRFRDIFPTFQETYMTLKRKGTSFPEVDASVPIFTPPPSLPADFRHAVAEAVSSSSSHAPAHHHPSPHRAPVMHQTQHVSPAPVQAPAPADNAEKLARDLSTVLSTASLVSDMTTAHSSIDDLKSDELLRDMVPQLREMQRRIIRLIENLPAENLLAALLDANERVSSALTTYDERLNSASVQQQQRTPIGAAAGAGSSPAPLLSFDDIDLQSAAPVQGIPIESSMASMSIQSAPVGQAVDDDSMFDEIARRSHKQPHVRQTGADVFYQPTHPALAPVSSPSVVAPAPAPAAMAQPSHPLQYSSASTPAPSRLPPISPSVVAPATASSSSVDDEFEDFLNSRLTPAKQAPQQPAYSSNNGPAASASPAAQTKLNQIEKDLFEL